MMSLVRTFLLLMVVQLWSVESRTTLEQLSRTVKILVEQLETQQFEMHQRVRSEGQSGLVNIRLRHSAVNNYQTETHTGRSAAAGHDHTNYPRTVGMGEFSAVLNGVAFKTRHNDYKLVMPSTSSKQLHAYEEIPFPKLPPAVAAKATLQEQVEELREWFKAWAKQDHSKRDYRPFFKPILCYLEGAWFKREPEEKITLAFNSTRHVLDAPFWWSLHQKVQFNAFSGEKNRKENLAFLPTAIFGTKADGVTPQLGQWNYRILCHPLKRDLPLKFLHPAEDLSARFFKDKKVTMHTHAHTRRSVRFAFNSKRSTTVGGQYQGGLLDELMEEIPGLDNYQGDIRSRGDDPERILSSDGTKPRNLAYYHRVYKVIGKDASGLGNVHRGYNDDYLFVARTTQETVLGKTFTPNCQARQKYPTWKCKQKFPIKHEKYSFAVPLELIYLTPLQAWNPLDIAMMTRYKEIAEMGTRNGGCTKEKAFKGSARIGGYYMTPYSFFDDTQKGSRSPADTVRNRVCVLNRKGQMVETRASGVYINIPKIKGINGRLRTRYPVYPVHGEGSSVWKELNAVRDLVMDSDLDQFKYKPEKPLPGLRLKMSPSMSGKVEQHVHYLDISAHEYDLLKANVMIEVTTTEDNGHSHLLQVMRRVDNGKEKFLYKTCDGKKSCWDRHKVNIWLA